jgi:hypothetical protein
MPVESAAGSNPRHATKAVIMIGRSRGSDAVRLAGWREPQRPLRADRLRHDYTQRDGCRELNLKFPYRTKGIRKISTTASGLRNYITFGLAHRGAVLAAPSYSRCVCTVRRFAAIQANFVARSYKRTIGGPGAVTKN